MLQVNIFFQDTGQVKVYRNTLVYAVHDRSSHLITRQYRFKLPVKCHFSVNNNANSYLHTHTGQLGHSSNIIMTLYSDPARQQRRDLSEFDVGEEVYATARLTDVTSGLLSVDTCYLQPSPSAESQYRYYLLKNRYFYILKGKRNAYF